jgi:hypothetical protein
LGGASNQPIWASNGATPESVAGELKRIIDVYYRGYSNVTNNFIDFDIEGSYV